jgi:tetratricopeptide (TPR) repeat protein
MWWKVLVLVCGLGCSPSASDLQKQATSALSSMQYDKALALSEQALALGESDPLLAWQLEQVRLEAMARKGQGAQVKAALEQLSQRYSAQVGSTQYLTMGTLVQEAGDTTGAIDLFAEGDKRFPEESAAFKTAIDGIKNKVDSDSAEIEKLKALGYL